MQTLLFLRFSTSLSFIYSLWPLTGAWLWRYGGRSGFIKLPRPNLLTNAQRCVFVYPGRSCRRPRWRGNSPPRRMLFFLHGGTVREEKGTEHLEPFLRRSKAPGVIRSRLKWGQLSVVSVSPLGFSQWAELENGCKKIDEFNVFQMSSLIHIITPRKWMDHHDTNSGERMLIAHQTGRLHCQPHNCSIYRKKKKWRRVVLQQISAIHLPFVCAHYFIYAVTSVIHL